MDIFKVLLLLVFIMAFLFIEENNIKFSHSKSSSNILQFSVRNFESLKTLCSEPVSTNLTGCNRKLSQMNKTEIRNNNITIYDTIGQKKIQ